MKSTSHFLPLSRVSPRSNSSSEANSSWYNWFTIIGNTISNLQKVLRATFLGSDRLFCSISICKFGSFKNPFAKINSLSEIYFRSRRFIQSVQTKTGKVISMNYCSSTSSWKPWRYVRVNLIIMMRDTSINSNLNPLTKFTSGRSTKLKGIFPSWNISRMTTKTVPISTRIAISYTMKRGIPFWVWQKVNGNWDNNLIRILQWRERNIRKNISVRRQKKSKTARLWESQSGILVGKLTIWERSFKVETKACDWRFLKKTENII